MEAVDELIPSLEVQPLAYCYYQCIITMLKEGHVGLDCKGTLRQLQVVLPMSCHIVPQVPTHKWDRHTVVQTNLLDYVADASLVDETQAVPCPSANVDTPQSAVSVTTSFQEQSCYKTEKPQSAQDDLGEVHREHADSASSASLQAPAQAWEHDQAYDKSVWRPPQGLKVKKRI